MQAYVVLNMVETYVPRIAIACCGTEELIEPLNARQAAYNIAS